MESNNTFRIATFGLSERELRVLKTICLVSRSRPRAYELLNAEASRTADFAIVNADDPEAVAAWQFFQASTPLSGAVMLTNERVPDWQGHQIGRPIMSTRLLAILDHLEVGSPRPATSRRAGVGVAETPTTDQPQVQQRPPADKERRPRWALVADQDPSVRRQIELELSPFVDSVDLAENGGQAIKLIASRAYDLVFLGVVLPGVDGYKLCRQMKRNEQTKDTPVIMLAGETAPFDQIKGSLAGCDTHLTKPLERASIAKVVQERLPQPQTASVDGDDPLGRTVAQRA